MSVFFASGLFDQPWLVLVFIVVGVVSNWLMKRRQEKEAGHQPEGNEPPPPSQPPGEFNLEETLRRLMGEESPTRPPSSPTIPRAARNELPPVREWPDQEQLEPEETWQKQSEEAEEEVPQPPTQSGPPLRPPLIVVERSSATTREASEPDEPAVRRFKQLDEQGRPPATVIGGAGRERQAHVDTRAASPWRNRQSARRAFVASLIFAPPKGLEP